MTLRRFLVVVTVCVVSAGWSLLESPDADVERGNQAFARGDYSAAIAAYREALQRRGSDPRIHYDIGTGLYALAETTDAEDRRASLYKLAEEALGEAVHARDSNLAAMARYNLGNALYRQGRYREAVEAYKAALRANPDSDDARYNLELATRHLRKDRARRGRGAPRGAPPDAQEPGSRAPSSQGPDSQKSAPKGSDSRDQSAEGRGSEQPGQGQGRQGQQGGESGSRGSAGGGNGQRDRQGSGDATPAPDSEPSGSEPSGGESPGDAAQGRQDGPGRDPRGAPPGPPGSDPAQPDRRRDGQGSPPMQDRGDQAAESSPGDTDKKLDALERMSRELHRRKLRRSRPRPGYRTPGKDW